jgi:hypothetical protein
MFLVLNLNIDNLTVDMKLLYAIYMIGIYIVTVWGLEEYCPSTKRYIMKTLRLWFLYPVVCVNLLFYYFSST